MLLGSSSRRPLWVIVASILLAACLNVLPIGLMGGYFQPDWVALVLIYWCLWEPERIGAGSGWCAGLLLDLLHGGLLGRFTLGKTLLGFVANKVSLRLRAYPVWQQSIGVAVLILLDTLVHALIRMLLDEEALHLARWMTPLSSMIMWPIVVIVLNTRSRQRRYR